MDRIFCPEGYFSLWGDSDQYMAQRMADRQMEYGSCLWFFECGVSDRSGFYLEWTEVDPAGKKRKKYI